MNIKSPCAMGVAFLLSLSLALPTELSSAPQTTGQRAGEVSRVIPAVNIARGGKTLTASAKSVVDWQDQINTLANARARVGLDDGSVLNVGSDSSMRVIKHDAAAQQTELELTYGKLRTQAQKISKPDGKFEVRTPAGVAGVVGTDFYVAFDSTNNVMNVVVFDGLVRVCNLAGACVIVKAGQMTNLRTNDNSAPPTPVQATLATLTGATTETDNGSNLGLVVANAHHIGTGTAIAIGVLAAIPAVVVPVVASHGKGKPAAPPTCQTDPALPQCSSG
ncbi:MAG: FecR family protein [Candidatus Acidiferrum sp.]|jgi:ferric-dicitrate binding protein FerR (iron transport regulator)